MRVSKINQQNFNFIAKTQIKEQNNVVSKQNDTAIMSNSIAETIGRSQVSFQAQKKATTKTIVTDEFTKTIEKDALGYTKITKEFANGKKEVTNINRDGNISSFFDKEGRQYIYDYEKKKILIAPKGGTQLSPIDMSTKDWAYSSCVQDELFIEEYDKKQHAQITRYAINNNITRFKQYNKQGEVIADIKYDPITGEIVRQAKYQSNGNCQISEYHVGLNTLTKKVTIQEDGSLKTTKKYGPIDGKMFDHTVEKYEKDELIDFKRFDARTKNLIFQKTKEQGKTSEYYYHPNGSPKRYTFSDEQGRTVETHDFEYGANSALLAETINYMESNQQITTLYGQAGEKKQETIFDNANNSILRKTIFHLNGNKKFEMTPNKEEMFNEDGIRLYSEFLDKNSRVAKRIDYYDDGETPQKETIYADKAKIEIEYDGDGNIVAAKAN